MLNIQNTNLYISVDRNDKRPDVDKQRDVLLATKQINLKTGESIVVFSRTTPEKLAHNKSLRPLMLAARAEVDNLLKESYFKKHGKKIPENLLKNIKGNLFHVNEKKYIPSSKKIASAAKQAENEIQSHDKQKSDAAPSDKTKQHQKIRPPTNSYSADSFEKMIKS
jgi:hypothetical protein